MGLVDYSDSDSGSDAPKATSASTGKNKRSSAHKLVDNGRIQVNLPQPTTNDHDDGPSAKRVKLGGSTASSGGGNRFSGFSSFLPPPKKAAVTSKDPASNNNTGSSKSGGAPRVGVHLKTSSEAAFSRTAENNYHDGNETNQRVGGSLSLTTPKAAPQPSIPEGQKPAEEVKLVGKPLMFKPLSVATRPGQKTKKKVVLPPMVADTSGNAITTTTTTSIRGVDMNPQVAPAPPKKVSLFSTEDEDVAMDDVMEEVAVEEEVTGPYLPENSYYGIPNEQEQNYHTTHNPTNSTPPLLSADPNSLDAIANDLNLDSRARRELFGRNGGPNSSSTASPATAKTVVNFNLDKEYQHNETLRNSGEAAQTYNPVKAINPGKHNLRQLVNAVQTQKEALEESFIANKSTQKQAGARYGWR